MADRSTIDGSTIERTTRRSRRLALTLGLNVALALTQLVAGLAAHSIGLLADAGHNLTDGAGIAVSLVAVRLTARPRSSSRTFGYHRGPILAALANAAVIAVVTVGIAVGSIVRLVHPRAAHGTTMVLVAAIAFAVNAGAALVLREDSADLNMRSAFLHMGGDALGSLAVLVAGGILVLDPSLERADPIAALAVGALILVEAVRILRDSIGVLLESVPADIDLAELAGAVTGVPEVAEVHDLHVWSLSSDVRALSAHIVLTGHPSLEEAQVVGERIKGMLRGAPYAISHSTLELECERCEEGEEDPCRVDGPATDALPAPAPAVARVPGPGPGTPASA
ncbi:MAG TPA: cation diffusion facilitator family transporter [Acidimicrobiales bacterium]|nr:cation diffusion facilitator family transporter [Acidimicrobiales bacterium]